MAYHEIQPPKQKSQVSVSETNPETEFGFLRVFFAVLLTRAHVITYGLLAIILIAAGVVRFLGAYQGLPYLTIHDEPELAGTALRMMQTGDFNPRYFNYGSLMMYVNLAVDVLHYFKLLGQPLHEPNAIRTLDELVVGAGDYRWTVSHPSFFLWNRWIVGLMGTASVALVFWIARLLLNHWAGLIGAAFLATTLFHVEHSAYITNDVPVSFLVLVAALFSLLYIQKASPGYLLTALAVCGLAAACKYNAVLSLMFPFSAFGLSLLMLPQKKLSSSAAMISQKSSVPHLQKRGWLRPRSAERDRTFLDEYMVESNANQSDVPLVIRSGYRHWLWAALVAVPPLFFLIAMPYALLDLPSFLLGAGWEVIHYKHLGHGADTVSRGLPYLLFQAKQFHAQFGTVGSAFAFAGSLFLLSKRLGWILLIFPLFYLLYMSTMIVSFHRNFLLLYPIGAIAIGCGIAWIGEWILRQLRMRSSGFMQTLTTFCMALFAVMLTIFFVVRFVEVAHYSYSLSHQPETRTAMISRVNELISLAKEPDDIQIGIASELHVHQQDLRRLAVMPTVASHLTLVDEFEQYDLIVTAATFMDGLENSTIDTNAAAFNAATTTLPSPTFTLAGREVVFLADWPVINPTLLVYDVNSYSSE